MIAKEGEMKEVSDKFSDVIIPVPAYLFTCHIRTVTVIMVSNISFLLQARQHCKLCA